MFLWPFKIFQVFCRFGSDCVFGHSGFFQVFPGFFRFGFDVVFGH